MKLVSLVFAIENMTISVAEFNLKLKEFTVQFKDLPMKTVWLPISYLPIVQLFVGSATIKAGKIFQRDVKLVNLVIFNTILIKHAQLSLMTLNVGKHKSVLMDSANVLISVLTLSVLLEGIVKMVYVWKWEGTVIQILIVGMATFVVSIRFVNQELLLIHVPVWLALQVRIVKLVNALMHVMEFIVLIKHNVEMVTVTQLTQFVFQIMTANLLKFVRKPNVRFILLPLFPLVRQLFVVLMNTASMEFVIPK